MVPRTLIQYWDKYPLPEDIINLAYTWQKHNPDMSYQLFDFEKAEQFILSEYGNEIAELFTVAALPAMQSDIFRLAYILAKGGLYLDMATECKAPIEPILTTPGKVVFMRKWHGGIWNGLIASEKKNLIIENIWKKVLDNIKNRRYEDVWKATGPYSYNAAIDQAEDDRHYFIYTQSELAKYFDLVNDLKHKKDAHWSKVQKNTKIYLS